MTEQFNMETSPEDPQNSIEQILDEKRFLIENLSTQLGFIESESMKELRSSIVDDQGQISSEMFTQWRDQAEAVVHAIKGKEDSAKAQIGLLLTKSLVYLKANMPNEFHDDIDDAISYAYHWGQDDLVDNLKGL